MPWYCLGEGGLENSKIGWVTWNKFRGFDPSGNYVYNVAFLRTLFTAKRVFSSESFIIDVSQSPKYTSVAE